VESWRLQLNAAVVVRDIAASSTHYQGISFCHPPSASAVVVEGREIWRQQFRQMRITQAGVPGAKGMSNDRDLRFSTQGRVEMTGGVVFAVWHETVQFALIVDGAPPEPRRTVETQEQRRPLRISSRGLEWDGAIVALPDGPVNRHLPPRGAAPIITLHLPAVAGLE